MKAPDISRKFTFLRIDQRGRGRNGAARSVASWRVVTLPTNLPGQRFSPLFGRSFRAATHRFRIRDALTRCLTFFRSWDARSAAVKLARARSVSVNYGRHSVSFVALCTALKND